MSKTKGKVKRKSRKVKNSRNRILYLIAALVGAIFIFTAGTMAIMVSKEIEEGEPPKRVEEAHLMVEEVFFIKSDTRADSGEVDILTTAYITNDGLADAENVEIHAYPRNQRYNLGSDKTKTFVGKIPLQKTAEIEFIVGVPMGEKIEVELLTLEKGRLIMTGSGTVVISGTSSSAEKYRTNTVTGTHNDTDYDGMPDAWESFYGFNPSDANDAYKDADGDGLTNLDEYRQSTEPCDAARKKKSENGLFGDDGDTVASSFGVLIVVIVIIIIIFIIVVIFSKEKMKSENKNKNNDNTPPSMAKPLSSPVYAQSPPYQGGWRCPKCGGWLSNGQCMSCGGRYSLSPIQVPPTTGNVTNADESKNE